MAEEIFISCGDPSGDLHASKLAGTLKMIKPGLRVSAAGGPGLRETSDKFFADLVGMNLHGYWEPVRYYGKIRKALRDIKEYLSVSRPSAVIAVDFYGFNINVCETAESLSIPAFYYISPQVWATRSHRIKRIGHVVKKVFVIFPFEETIYRKAGVDAVFVGHPMLDDFTDPINPKATTDTPFIGIFPGSRKQVVKWNLPIMLETAEIIRKRMPGARFVIAGMENLRGAYGDTGRVEIVFDRGYGWRKNIDLAISASGTVTLENALLGIPMVVCYRLPRLMYYLVKSMVKVHSITMINLIMGESVVKEFVQREARPEKIASAAVEIISDAAVRDAIIGKYRRMKGLLGAPGSYERTARLILGELRNA
jgi:lipid-A-disaccharide synthase